MDTNTSEFEELRKAVGDSMLAWSGMEGWLAQMFSATCFGDAMTEKAAVIFYSLNNFESRLRLTNDMLEYTLAAFPDTLERWGKLKGAIQRKQGPRNKIAHGVIASVGVPSKGATKNFVRITPALENQVGLMKEARIPGLGLSDVRGFTSSVGRLSEKLSWLHEAICLQIGANSRFTHHGSEQPTLFQLFQKLDA